MVQSNENRNTKDVRLWTSGDLLVHWLFGFFAARFFRVRAQGSFNVQPGRAVLLVCNYQSLLDGLIVSIALQRPVRFMVDEFWYNDKKLHWIWKLLKAIPLVQEDSPLYNQMLSELSEAVEAKQNVCVFGEGSLSKTSQLRPFKEWIKEIEGDYDILPTYIVGSWESCFSNSKGRPHLAFSLKRVKVKVCIGEILTNDTEPVEIFRQIGLLKKMALEAKLGTKL